MKKENSHKRVFVSWWLKKKKEEKCVELYVIVVKSRPFPF